MEGAAETRQQKNNSPLNGSTAALQHSNTAALQHVAHKLRTKNDELSH